jgi:hypothetical protein
MVCQPSTYSYPKTTRMCLQPKHNEGSSSLPLQLIAAPECPLLCFGWHMHAVTYVNYACNILCRTWKCISCKMLRSSRTSFASTVTLRLNGMCNNRATYINKFTCFGPCKPKGTCFALQCIILPNMLIWSSGQLAPRCSSTESPRR